MKIIEHSQVPKDYTYNHLGYTSAAAIYKKFLTETVPVIILVIVLIIALFKILKKNIKK